MADHNATDSVSRRNVLKTAGGLMAGATLLAGQAAGDEIKPLNLEIEEMTEEVIATNVSMSEELYERVNERGSLAEFVFLGVADRFVIHDDEVSLPEETEGLARPVHTEAMGGGETNWMIYFRTGDVDFSGVDGEEVTMGLGVFTERTIPKHQWDACPGHRVY